MSSIRIDGGLIELDDKPLKAVVTSVSINNEVVWKEQTMLLESGNEKIFNGFQDAQIDLSLVIYEEHDGGVTRYADMQRLSSAFKALKDKEAVVYQIYGSLFDALSIREVVFSYMTAMELDDSLQVNITFKENNPKVSAVQKQQMNTTANESAAEADWTPVSDEEVRGLEGVEDSIR